MGTGYTRNDTANNIADGNVINAADFDGEFDAIVTAFSTSGHTHDGTSAEGGPITKIGPAQDITVSTSVVTPKTTNTLDLGSSSSQFKDIYIDGSAYIDGLAEDILVATDKKVLFRDSAIYINSSTDGQLDIVADTEVQIAATTIDINGNVDISGSLSVGSFSLGEIDSSGNLTLDAESDIILDANGADVLFKDNGTQYGALTNSSGNLIIKSGSTTALTFSGANVTAAGNLTVDGNLDVTGTLDLSDSNFTNVGSLQLDSISGDADTNTSITFSGSDVITVATGGTTSFTVDASQNILMNAAQKVQFRDTALTINSSTDGQLDIDADTELEITAPTVDINASTAVLISNDLKLDSDSAVLGFGADNDTTLTHTDGTGLTLNSTNKLTFGDAASFVQQSSNGVLRIDGEATIDLNASTAVTVSNDLKLDSDAAVLGFGVDNDVTLTHVADTGLLLNGTSVIQFNDTSQNIGAPSGSKLEINAGSEVEINATTVDINGSIDLSGSLNSGSIASGFGNIDIGSSNLTATGTVSLGGTSFNDNNITNVGDIALDSISADSTDINIAVSDNSATAFTIKQGSDAYLIVDTGNSSESVAIGTGVSGTAISIGHTTSETTINDNLTVTGDLTVSGTTTTVNSTTVNLNDHNIVLDSGNSTSAVINGAGITIEGGSGDDATFTYNTSGPKFELKLGSSHEDLQVDQLIAASLDISGNADIDGTLEADVITVNGTALDEFISDTVGAMVSSNTETGISVTYADGDNTLDFALSTAQTSIESIKNTSLVIGRDDDNLIKFSTDNQIIFEVDGGDNVIFKSSGEIEASSLDISGDVDIDGTLETDALSINGTAVNSTAAELNIMDGGTSASSTTLVAADRVVTNDNGTMKQVAISDFQTYFQNNLTFGSTGTGSSDIVTVGALDSGSISTGFGNIDNGSSNITTGGLLKLDVDADADDLTGDSATGRLTLGAGEDLNLYHGGTNSYIVNDTGDLYIDTAGDLYFDAAGNETRFLFGGTQVGLLRNSSSDFIMQSSVSDKDIIFNGNMGGSVSTALTLDMSNSGRAIFNEDLDLQSDSSVLRFGSDGEIRFKHNHNTGLDFIHQTADTTGPNLNFVSKNTTVTNNNVLGSITFQADNEGSGSDAVLQSAGIFVVAEGTFTSSANPTKFVFSTSASEAAAFGDGDATVIQSDGDVTIGKNLTVGGDLDVLTSGLTTATTAVIGTQATVGTDLIVGDDILLDSDSAIIQFGDDQDVFLSHLHNTGLILTAANSDAHLPILTLKTTGTSDDTFPILRLESSENNVSANEPIGSIQFKANDASGTDAELVSAGIHAIGETNFTSSANPTKLVFTTGESEVADHTAAEKMALSSSGTLTILEDVVLKDGGTIGSDGADDTLVLSGSTAVNLGGNITLHGQSHSNASEMHFKNGSTEVMRIKGGNVLIGTTSQITTASFNPLLNVESSNNPVFFKATGGAAVAGMQSGGTTSAQNFLFFTNQAGSAVGSIQISNGNAGTGVSYNETSDYRVKENISDISDAITRVKQLSPRRFNFISQEDITVDGFIAHEAQTVVPEAVTGTKDQVDIDGNPVLQGIDKSKLVPLLTAALQEAISKIETLETKVAALEQE